MNDKSPVPVTKAKSKVRRFRVAGIVVLASGIVAAGIVYWLGTREPDVSNDISMQGFNRTRDIQMGRLYGKSGLMIDDFSDWLQQPGAQAILIVIVSILTAAGCFYFAHLLDGDDEAGEIQSS